MLVKFFQLAAPKLATFNFTSFFNYLLTFQQIYLLYIFLSQDIIQSRIQPQPLAEQTSSFATPQPKEKLSSSIHSSGYNEEITPGPIVLFSGTHFPVQENNHSRLRLLKRRASSPFIYLPTMVLPWRYDPTTTPSLESNSNSVLQSNSTKGKDFCSLDQRKGNILGKG